MSGSDAADLAALGTGSSTPPTGNHTDYEALARQLQKDVETWQTRFTGMQGTYAREKAKWDSDNKRLGEVSTQLAALTQENETLKSITELTSGSASLYKAELENYKAQVERSKVLISKFPHLLSFEAEGLLPDGTGPEFEAKLKTFSDRLQTLGVDTLKKQVAGSAPPPPGGGASKTKEEAWKQVQQYLREGKTSEYNAAYTEYLALSKGT